MISWQKIILTPLRIIPSLLIPFKLGTDQLKKSVYFKLMKNQEFRYLRYKALACTKSKDRKYIPAVYEWNYTMVLEMPNKKRFSLNDARTLIYRIYDVHAPNTPYPQVLETGKKWAASAKETKIYLFKKTRLTVILHEVSHTLNRFSGHGIRFVSIWIKLLAEYGFGNIDMLVQSANEYGVKTLSSKTIKECSIKQIGQERRESCLKKLLLQD